MKKNIGLKKLVFAALCCAVSVVIGWLCKLALTFAGGALRITFENLPLILCSALLGPLWSAACGVASDIVSCILAGNAINPVITLGTVCVCAISGVFFRYIIKRKSFPMILLSVFVSHAVGSVGVKTYGLSLYGIPAQVLLLRIPLYICIAAAESYLLWLLLRNKTISSFGGDIK